MRGSKRLGLFAAMVAAPLALAAPAMAVMLTNVSYDPTREFYEAYNTAFAAH